MTAPSEAACEACGQDERDLADAEHSDEGPTVAVETVEHTRASHHARIAALKAENERLRMIIIEAAKYVRGGGYENPKIAPRNRAFNILQDEARRALESKGGA